MVYIDSKGKEIMENKRAVYYGKMGNMSGAAARTGVLKKAGIISIYRKGSLLGTIKNGVQCSVDSNGIYKVVYMCIVELLRIEDVLNIWKTLKYLRRTYQKKGI